MGMNFDMEEVMEIEHTFGSKAKKPTDENAPKRALSAYFLWANTVRPGLIKENEGASMAVVGKKIGNMWKKLSDSDKAPFQKKADAQKKAYQAKREKYEKSANYRKFQMTLLAWKIHETKKPFPRDENAPKRASSAYQLYAASVRKQIVKENPDMAVTEVMKEQSVWWKALSSDEQQKWKNKAAAGKKQHEAKVARYMKTSDYRNHVEARDKYKAEMLEKRNKLMGVKKKRARDSTKANDTPKSPSKKKQKKRSASKSRSVSRRRSAKKPKSPKRRSRKRRAEKRKGKAPRRSKSRSASRRSSRRSSSRKSRTPKRRSASRSKSRRRSSKKKATE